MSASDSFIGEGLTKSPYQELRRERDHLFELLHDASILLSETCTCGTELRKWMTLRKRIHAAFNKVFHDQG